jgi:hypothetical protein
LSFSSKMGISFTHAANSYLVVPTRIRPGLRPRAFSAAIAAFSRQWFLITKSSEAMTRSARNYAAVRLGALGVLLLLVGSACGDYSYPAEDPNLASHMSFVGVFSDASGDPAVITGTVRFVGDGTATHVVVAAKVGDATGQASLTDMSSGSSQGFRVEVRKGPNAFQMHVEWVESGRQGYLSY